MPSGEEGNGKKEKQMSSVIMGSEKTVWPQKREEKRGKKEKRKQ